MEVADDNFGVLQAVVVNQVLQLEKKDIMMTTINILLMLSSEFIIWSPFRRLWDHVLMEI